MSSLTLFDYIDEAQAERDRINAERQKRSAELNQIARQPKQCSDCGEWSPNEYLWSTNHRGGEIAAYGGMCIRHWDHLRQAELWAHAEDSREWLRSHGFDAPNADRERTTH